ncbi:uncharacterized protein FIESC28_07650 [Fusarium coffeatum]|uniref:25S rRNA (Uridine(2843)-N(3))-methyltransferase n=1 Tax=Fusarium coffeatum TaxID=231269 RepID=A0A366RBJ6_9HYPO|nr:uncharacterized protein FIESC28_07650 [Fusarium coffeatum]RBR14521.1 hypothetical protein FIESC28_07650 [Fusarium coffeatum]
MGQFKRHAQSQPKHGKPLSSGASKAPIPPPVNRPGWSGPTYLHKNPKRKPAAVKEKTQIPQIQSLSIEHQQLILDTIRTSFPAVDDFSTLTPVLREVREALEQKDYSKAFGSEEFKEAYTIRWSPSRALTAANVLAWICSEMSEAAWVQQFLLGEEPSKIACIGRGGSDLLACVTLLKHSHQGKLDEIRQSESASSDADDKANALFDLSLIDNHDWSTIITKLQNTLTAPPPLSKYATEKAKAANVSAIPPQVLNPTLSQLNILESENTTLQGPNPTLITLFFTLHEFYSISISKTTAFLKRLTSEAPKGSLLLIVDGPGAEVALPSKGEGEEKRYPLEWLLYQALLPPKSKDSEEEVQPAWKKLIEDGHEKEYKLPAGLRYPGSLENTRFQVHLLERL